MSVTWMAQSHSEEQTESIARGLARCLTPGTAIRLSGDLGSGKSVFARGLIRGLGVEEEYLPSPTFTLVNVYGEGRLPIAHFDLYRLTSPEDLETLGIEEYVDGAGVVIVEWAERGGNCFFGEPMEVRFADVPGDPQARQITMVALGSQSREILHAFQQQHLFGR